MNEKVEEAKEHIRRNRPTYVGGAIGFLLGGFVVLAFGSRPQIRIIVDTRKNYMLYDERRVRHECVGEIPTYPVKQSSF